MTKNIYVLSIIVLFVIGATAQEKHIEKEVSFITKDNIAISASYLTPKNNSKSYPAIILIHQGGSSRQEWLESSIIESLLNEGFVLLAYDVRQHGKSAKDKGDLFNLFNNPKRAPLDVQAAIKFLKEDSRINQDRIGILGASIGANLACVAINNNYGIKSAISLSSKTEAVQNLSGKKELLNLKNIFHIASANEQGGLRKQWAEELYAKTKGERKIAIAKGGKHGSYILRSSPDLNNQVIEWFKKTL